MGAVVVGVRGYELCKKGCDGRDGERNIWIGAAVEREVRNQEVVGFKLGV